MKKIIDLIAATLCAAAACVFIPYAANAEDETSDTLQTEFYSETIYTVSETEGFSETYESETNTDSVQDNVYTETTSVTETEETTTKQTIITGWINENNKRKYYLPDGTAAVGKVTIENIVYFFDSNGFQKTGWQKDSGKLYYYYPKTFSAAIGIVTIDNNIYSFDKSGALRTGWQDIGGKRYYIGEDGSPVYGWIDYFKNRYYTDSDGVKHTGWLTENTNKYYFNTDGIMQTGWLSINGNKYYLGSDGVMQTGWLIVKSNKYYLDSNGIMQTGWITIEGNKYYLDSNGIMQTGWLAIKGNKYYLSSDGIMQTGWLTIEDNKYYLDSDGITQTGWLAIKGNKYYFDSDGIMQTGWINIENDKYYFDSSGIMAADTEIDGASLDSTGKMIKKIIDVPYINQNNYPTGCESCSSVMILNYYGVDISVDSFIDGYLDTAPVSEINGYLYGPDPNESFAGSPYNSYRSYGCYSKTIEKAFNNILDNDQFNVKNTSGTSVEDLIDKYVKNDIPVLFWATMNMSETRQGRSWYIYNTDHVYTWKAGEHCLVLVGYDENNYYFNDPYLNHGLIAYKKPIVCQRYMEQGYNSLVVLKK